MDAASARRASIPTMRSNYKQCMKCGKLVSRAAYACRRCGKRQRIRPRTMMLVLSCFVIAGMFAVASASALLAQRAPGISRAAALGLAGAYGAFVGRAHVDAIAEPTPARLQKSVGAGIMGLMPLEAGLLAGSGSVVPAAGVAALFPLARKMAKRRKVT
jgi:ribosomal protein L40E